MIVEVTMLDGVILPVEISSKASGIELLDALASSESVNLLEKDYFGLKYFDKKENSFLWVQNDRRLSKQLKEPMKAIFQVKFYPPDPAQLQEDLTRYLLCLQIQQDVKSGKLPCSFVTHALLGAYLVQSELGDYEPVDHGLSPDYIREFDFAPNQSEDLLQRIMDVHKTLKGQTPAEAELHYLDNAKKLAMYGVTLQSARDSEGVDIMLGVCSSGILVYRDRLRINRFAWPKIIKISYKRNGFYIKIRPGEFEHFESSVGFKLENHKAAKRLWKICVENHSFFRLLSPDKQEKPKFPRFGSRFRYSGRTQAQAKKNFATLERTNPAFERTGTLGRGATSPGGANTNPNNTLSSQSMQGISPRHNRSPNIDEKTKRHTLGHNLPDQVQQELQDAQRERMAKSYDPSGFKDEKPVVAQPGVLQQGGKMATPPTTPGAAGGGYGKSITNGHSMDSHGVGLQGQGGIPAYSPAYKQTTGPQYTRQAPGKPPMTTSTHETTFDAENSAATTIEPPVSGHDYSYAMSTDEAVDIDAMLGDTGEDDEAEGEEDYEFSRTDRLLRTEDGAVSQHTQQTVSNLLSGEADTQEFNLAGTAPGQDRVQAESVTTRMGRIHQDKTTGEKTAVLESKTMSTSHAHSTEPGLEPGTLTSSITTSRKESTMSVRKESVINSSSSKTVQEHLGITDSSLRGRSSSPSNFGGAGVEPASSADVSGTVDIDDALKSAEVSKDEYANAEGMVVSSQTITSKSRTVETTTYAVEQEGQTETHIEQKVTIQSDGDIIDHDEALAQAIQEATAMNPDFTVEKIEISQTTSQEKLPSEVDPLTELEDGGAEV